MAAASFTSSRASHAVLGLTDDTTSASSEPSSRKTAVPGTLSDGTDFLLWDEPLLGLSHIVHAAIAPTCQCPNVPTSNSLLLPSSASVNCYTASCHHSTRACIRDMAPWNGRTGGQGNTIHCGGNISLQCAGDETMEPGVAYINANVQAFGTPSSQWKTRHRNLHASLRVNICLSLSTQAVHIRQ